MIYLHCGLPKTGTCSLQAALVEHQDELAEGGILYPEKWRREVDGSHNDLDGVLSASRQSQAPIAEFKRFLRLHADRDVLLSSESLFLWTTTDEGRDLLLRLLMVAEEVAPVRCIWTLRRLDEVACSWYRQIMLAGIKTAPAARFLGGLKPSPAGLQHIEEAIGEVKYVKYDVAGYHNAELLRDAAGRDRAGVRADPWPRRLRRIRRRRPRPRLAPLRARRRGTAGGLDPLPLRLAIRARSDGEAGADDLGRTLGRSGREPFTRDSTSHISVWRAR